MGVQSLHKVLDKVKFKFKLNKLKKIQFLFQEPINKTNDIILNKSDKLIFNYKIIVLYTHN